jgi:lysozyme family protein
MPGFSYGVLRQSYAQLWKTMQVPAAMLPATDACVRAIAKGKPRYDQVANATGVPWYVIGIIHEMEGGLSFKTHLHNGDPLTARTVQVPAGRPLTGSPPFQWEESAIDALTLDGLTAIKLWTIERIAYQLEGYNGWGYRTRKTGVNTPYLWSATTNYQRGKFVRDGVFDPNAVSSQVGAMALLRRMIDVEGVNIPAEEDVPLPDAPPPPADADLARQPYPGVVVRLNHPEPAVVMLLQRRLNQLGCWPQIDAQGRAVPLDVDGDFGQGTASAVKLFQARSVDAQGKPMSVDGVVGPATWAALFAQAPLAPVVLTPIAPAPVLLRKVIEVASVEEQHHIREVPLGSNRGPRVDEYLRAAGIDPSTGNYPWCASFIVWCFENAARGLGVTSPVPRTAGVHDMWLKAGQAGFRRIPYETAIGDPAQVQAGQVFFIDTGGGHGHTGLVVGRNGNEFQTIEGNTNELGGREGIGVFARSRPVRQATLGFVEFNAR